MGSLNKLTNDKKENPLRTNNDFYNTVASYLDRNIKTV